MKFVRDAVMGQQWIIPRPLFGNATNIAAGAAVIRGATDGTNLGFDIIAPTNTSMSSGLFVGVTEALFAAATLDNDPSGGTKYILTQVTINPHAIYEAQYDNAISASHFTNGLAIASLNTSTPSVTVTSGENLGGGWLFFDNFELHYVLSSSSGTYTLKSATSAAIVAGTTKVAKIMYKNAPKITLITAATQIGIATAAQGNIQAMVLTNFIRGVGYDNVELDPTKHDNIILPSPNSVSPAIYGHIMFTQSFLNTL